MKKQYTYTSLTRISDLEKRPFQNKRLSRSDWSTGDYVIAEIVKTSGDRLKIETPSGRMIEPMIGDLVIGAFGTRSATLEATGCWSEVLNNGKMHLLTGAGLFGKMTSRSVFVPGLIEMKYKSHIIRKNRLVKMMDFVPVMNHKKFTIPVVLVVGTSMSAGKTTSARIISRILRDAGCKVVGAKLTGAGRYRDILTIKDAGAEFIFDFVDVGLPSSICPVDVYQPALKKLLTMIEKTKADVAVIEIGASPLEPYNGDIAISEIRNQIMCTVLCASDPYAVYGVMKSFDMVPTLVSGPATNTLAGIELIKKLCKVLAINVIDPKNKVQLKEVLGDCLNLKL